MTDSRERHLIDEYLCQMRDGNRSALSSLYTQTAKSLYAFCYTYLHNHADCEDAVSDTYLKIQLNIQGYKSGGGFAWMCTIAKNTCLNMLKSKARTVNVDFSDEETQNAFSEQLTEPMPEIDGEDGILSLAERVLSEKEYRVVVLHTVNGFRFGEIAKMLGGFEATARWQYHNALKKLKKECEVRGIR